MPAPFEVAALQGALDIIEAVKVRLDLAGMREFSDGAYIAIARYEVATAARTSQRKERPRIDAMLRARMYRRRKKRGE